MKLPVWPKDEHDIIDEDGKYVGFVNSPEDRKYIIKAINSHDKLVKNLENINNCLVILANTKSEEGIRDLPELINNLWKYVEQVLKEKP